jgi:PAS domain S-box-containing protein
LRTRSGRILGTLGVSRDITRHKGVEEALQRERDRLRTLIDNLPDVIFIKDSEFRLVTVNRAFIRQFGAPSEADVLGKTDFDFCPVDLAQSYRSDDERVILRGETLVNREEEILSPELGRISILTTKVPLRDAHGEIVGLVGICRDISERKTTEDALKQSEWLYHSLVDNLPVFVVRKDLEGRITYATFSLANWPRSIAATIAPSLRAARSSPTSKRIAAASAIRGSKSARRRSGTRPVALSARRRFSGM